MKHLILAINPGSTSTKIAVFDQMQQVFLKNIKHTTEQLSVFGSIADQYDFRKNTILEELKNNNINLDEIAVVMGRGGLVKPLTSGVYRVNDLMKKHLREGYNGQHACNLGGLIADSIAKSIGLEEAYIADPVVVDEFEEVARISGHPKFERLSIFHALNQKAISRMYANDNGKKYEDCCRVSPAVWRRCCLRRRARCCRRCSGSGRTGAGRRVGFFSATSWFRGCCGRAGGR